MIDRFRFLATVWIAFVICSATMLSAADFKSPPAQLELEDGDALVFLGDSITHQCLYTQYVEDFYLTRYPHKRIKFHNAGVGGAKAIDALARFDRDVAALKPKYVTVLLGMNDGRYQPYDNEIFETYRKDMRELIAKIRGIGATPILMTPTMYDARAARLRSRHQEPNPRHKRRQMFYNSTLAYYGAWLREIAVEAGDGFVDMYSPLNNLTLQQRKSAPKFTLIQDAVHPGAAGQLVMAHAILHDMNAGRTISEIHIAQDKNSQWTALAIGGNLTDLRSIEGGLQFNWTADSLPWVLPGEARQADRLLQLGHRMSREALDVYGFTVGNYELSIDGRVVGNFDASRLARGIELQRNSKTPQYQQSLQVAVLNKNRNDGPIHSLRDEWLLFQSYDRRQRRLKTDPTNIELAEQVAVLKRRLDGMEDRIAELAKVAQEIEDRIFQLNQPKTRTFKLTRMP